MHKLMCTFATPMKKKIPDRNLDTSCPAGIPCNNVLFQQVKLDILQQMICSFIHAVYFENVHEYVNNVKGN